MAALRKYQKNSRINSFFFFKLMVEKKIKNKKQYGENCFL